MPHISKHLYTKKNGKLVRRKDIEKEEPTHLPPQKKPTSQLNWLKDLRHRIIWGNADLSEFNLFFFYSYTEWPTVPGISHLKIKNPKDGKEEKISEQVWLAEATYQVLLKLNDWLVMSILNEKLQNLISLGKPFTRSIETIENTAREIQNILPSALPNYESRYERGYETFKGVLYNLDKSNDTVVERLGNFQNAVKDFESLIRTIHDKIIRIITRHNSIKSDSDIQEKDGQGKTESKEQTGPKMILNGDLIFLRRLESSLALMLRKKELSRAESVRQSKYITKAIRNAHGVIDSNILGDEENNIIEELLLELEGAYKNCTTSLGDGKEYLCDSVSDSGYEEELIVLESRIKGRFLAEIQKILSDRPLIVTEKTQGNGGQDKTNDIAIDDKELTILVELAEGSDKTYSQVEIEAATSIPRGTIKDKLPRLESIGLIHRPLGKRKGYQITDKGREIAKRNE